MDWTIIITAFTGLVLFLFGIQHLSKEIISAVGNTFRKLLERFTSNRVKGAFLGAGVTAVIQSSIATIVIATGLVNGGIISFTQSLGIVIGANVGTTLTAQLVAFNVMSFAPIFLILGFLLSMFGKEKYKLLGKSVFYFGLVFFSLNLMSNALIPIQENPQVMAWLAQLSNVFIALAVGFLITSVVQSSSVTTGIVVVLASSGMITLPQGIPLLLGANIGSTLPIIFTSFKLNLHAKRVAMAHLIFNVVGALILIPFILPFSALVASIGGGTGQQIANAHTIFNIGMALIFLVLLTPYKYLIKRIVPGKEKEILQKTKYLENKLPEDNKKAIELVKNELTYSLNINSKILEKANQLLKSPSTKQLDRLERYRSLNKLLDQTIDEALLEISKRDLDEKDHEELAYLIRLSNALEQLGSIVGGLGHVYIQTKNVGEFISKESKKDIKELTQSLKDMMVLMAESFPQNKSKGKIKSINREIEKSINRKYKKYFQRLRKKKAVKGSVFIESISIIEAGFVKIQEIGNLIRDYRKKY